MVLDKLPVPGRPTIWITVGQGPTALTVGAGGGCLDIFSLLYPFSPLSPSLWETARYRLKYCLKGSLNPKQPTNQPPHFFFFIWIHKKKITYSFPHPLTPTPNTQKRPIGKLVWACLSVNASTSPPDPTPLNTPRHPSAPSPIFFFYI